MEIQGFSGNIKLRLAQGGNAAETTFIIQGGKVKREDIASAIGSEVARVLGIWGEDGAVDAMAKLEKKLADAEARNEALVEKMATDAQKVKGRAAAAKAKDAPKEVASSPRSSRTTRPTAE